MELKERISELKTALSESHSSNDWRQHPEENKGTPSWGSSDLISWNSETKKWETIARVYDSGNQKLIISMRKHIEALIEEIEKR